MPTKIPGPRRRPLGLILALILLAVLAVLSVMIGSKMFSPVLVWDALFHPTAEFDHFAIRDFRVPRTIVGLVVGAALGVSGALIQALTRNPLADTGILGVSAGSSFAVIRAPRLRMRTFVRGRRDPRLGSHSVQRRGSRDQVTG